MKDAIRSNFDESPSAYEDYERLTDRFATLSERLYDEMTDRMRNGPGTVLDAGAGTGASSRRLSARGTTPIALDISRPMLRENPCARRIQGDFDHLPLKNDSVDAVVFTASLFLTPEPERAAIEAGRVCRPAGAVGAVAPLGWTTDDGTDVFASLPRDSRSPASVEAVEEALRSVFDVEAGVWSFETTAEALRRFHAVPAMAARLYPRLGPNERIERANALLADVEGPLEQRWRWFVGR